MVFFAFIPLSQEILVKPGGDLPEGGQTHRFQASAGQRLRFEITARHRGKWPGLRVGVQQPSDDNEDSVLQELGELAATADAVICCAGFDRKDEGEAHDRSFALGGKQAEQIRCLGQANPRTVVALFSGGPVDCRPWLDHSAALIQGWYPGQIGSRALAEILLGDQAPEGRLPQTWNASLDDYAATPFYHSHDLERRVRYAEGVFIGHRHNHRAGIAPLFPFGFGLGYTTIAIDKVCLEAPQPASPDQVVLRARLRNTGDQPGSEVLQLYCGDTEPVVPRPEVELHTFAKRRLEAGTADEVALRLDARLLRYYDPDARSWRFRPGRYRLWLGTSAEHIVWRGTVDLRSVQDC